MLLEQYIAFLSIIFLDNIIVYIDSVFGKNQPPGNYCERVIPDPFRTRKSSLSAPMVLCLKVWESRSLPGL